MYDLSLHPHEGENFTEPDDGLEWGWMEISETVRDEHGREFLLSRRFLYYSPDECRERFKAEVAENGWTLTD